MILGESKLFALIVVIPALIDEFWQSFFRVEFNEDFLVVNFIAST